MNILDITKGIAGTAASLGVGTVVSNAINATTPADVTKLQKVIVGIGGLAVTSLVGEAAVRRTEQKVDEFSKTVGYPKNEDVEEPAEEQ